MKQIILTGCATLFACAALAAKEPLTVAVFDFDGNLISCQARAEAKVHDVRARQLVTTERQTSVAVDVAEQTAAKTALQDAAAQLAARLVPLLGK